MYTTYARINEETGVVENIIPNSDHKYVVPPGYFEVDIGDDQFISVGFTYADGKFSPPVGMGNNTSRFMSRLMNLQPIINKNVPFVMRLLDAEDAEDFSKRLDFMPRDVRGLLEMLAAKVDVHEGMGLSENNYTSEDRKKLSGIEENSTANADNDFLLDRKNHTGKQDISTITGMSIVAETNKYTDLSDLPFIPKTFDDIETGDKNKIFSVQLEDKLNQIQDKATQNYPDEYLLKRDAHTGTQPADTIEGLSKVATSNKYEDLDGIPFIPKDLADVSGGSHVLQRLETMQDGATRNASDASLTNRGNHSGSQPISTVGNLQSSLDEKPDVWFGALKQVEPVLFQGMATVASGVATFYLTSDGSPDGQILMKDPHLSTFRYFINSADIFYTASASLNEDKKILTITVNKIILSDGILIKSQANGEVVNISIWGQ